MLVIRDFAYLDKYITSCSDSYLMVEHWGLTDNSEFHDHVDDFVFYDLTGVHIFIASIAEMRVARLPISSFSATPLLPPPKAN